MEKNYVLYSSFGAKGDGVADDFKAINAAHEYANAHGLSVRADVGAAYYIGRHDSTIEIRTSTDWTGATIIIDDRYQPVEDREIHVFHVGSALPSCSLNDLGIKSISKGQGHIDVRLENDCYVTLTDESTRLFIREGLNQNNGVAQTDCFILRANGDIDPTTPVIWNFDNVSDSNVRSVDEVPLTLRGGTFVTIANQAPSEYTYYTTNILIERSNVTVTGMRHFVQGELDHGAPYDGIIQVNYCANVIIEDCLFTAHRMYGTIGAAKLPVNMGSYDVRQRSAINVTYRNCNQTTDILDSRYWGVFVSDFCKNLRLENCVFSRFDAHMGVTNTTITGCTLGHQCLNAIGHGTLTVENSTLYGANFINLRGDYGSTWDGDVVIRHCNWEPRFGKEHCLIHGTFSGNHDFGYECHMPHNIKIDGLDVKSDKPIYLFSEINSTGEFKYPYNITEKVDIGGYSSDEKWIVSPNPDLFRTTKISEA